MIRRQPRTQPWRLPPQRLQQFFRTPQPLRRQQGPDFPGQCRVQSAQGDYDHRMTGPGVPEDVSVVVQGGQGRCPAIQAEADREQLPPDAMPRRRTEHGSQHKINRGSGQQKPLPVHIGIKDAVDYRNGSPCQQSQAQYAARHSAGQRKQKHRQAEQPRFSAEGQQGQQDPRRQLYRRRGKKGAPRKEHRRGISTAGKGRQKIALSLQRQTGQSSRCQKQQIVHDRIQNEHAVYVDHCHDAAPHSRLAAGRITFSFGFLL